MEIYNATLFLVGGKGNAAFSKHGNIVCVAFSGDHRYHLESETLMDHALEKFSDLGIEKEIDQALRKIPDEISAFTAEQQNAPLAAMGWAKKRHQGEHDSLPTSEHI